MTEAEAQLECNLCSLSVESTGANVVHKVLEHGLSYCERCETLFDSLEEKILHDDFLHAQIRCTECPARFGNSFAQLNHAVTVHQKAPCELCGLELPSDSLPHHLEAAHRLDAWGGEPLITRHAGQPSEGLAGQHTTPFGSVKSPTTSTSCYDCLVCNQSFAWNQMVGHLLARHRLSKNAVIQQFAAAAHSAPGVESRERGRLELSVCPDGEYSCSICHIQFRDSGLHLLLQHGMMKCPAEDCATFFSSCAVMASHQHSCHQPHFQCSVCLLQLSSQYMLVAHTSEEHSIHTCVLCQSATFSSKQSYTSHLSSIHAVERPDLLGNLLSFINSNLAIYHKREVSIDCQLCGPNRPPIAAADGGGGGHEFLCHLSRVHAVPQPGRLMTRLLDLDTGCFTYKRLRAEHDDLYHDPLVNLNPLVNFVGSGEPSAAASRDTKDRNSSNGGADGRTRTPVGGGASAHHLCIVCSRSFFTSEEVQYHLLVEHVAAATTAVAAGRSGEAASLLAPSSSVATIDRAVSVVEEARKARGEDRQRDAVSPAESTSNRSERVVEAGQAEDPLCSGNEPSSRKKDQSHASDIRVTDRYKEDTQEEEEEKEEEEEEDLEIDEEHFSINNVEVSLEERDTEEKCSSVPLEPAVFIKEEEEEEEEQDEEDEQEELSSDLPEIEGKIGKAPVFLKCELCGVVLASILSFNHHMKREHKDSELERNKPYKCDICYQEFHFVSSLNSHKSKAHFETTGVKFTCPLCPSVTNSKNGMRRHLKNTHKETGRIEEELSFKCKRCGEMFFSNTDRMVHMMEMHKECQDIVTCHICAHIAPNKHALRRHFLRMHPSEPIFDKISYDCEHCGVLFSHKLQLSSHMKEHHPPKRKVQECDLCHLVLSSQRALRMHRKRRHRDELRAEGAEEEEDGHSEADDGDSAGPLKVRKGRAKFKRAYRCKFCSEGFLTVVKRTEHYNEVHPGMLAYICPHCGAGFKNKSALYNHKVIHNSPTLFTCADCDKTFKRRDSYKEHILIHNGPRHKCPHCPKEFVQKSNLNRHVRIHLGIKPYSCDLCQMTFSDKGACNSHIRTHTGEERQACEICGVIFSKKQKLKYHMRTHTGENLKSCLICNKAFTHSYALNSHLRTHQKKGQYMCYLCKQGFMLSGKALYAHLMWHGTEEFACHRCNKKFRFQRLLNRHILAVHDKVQGFECKAERCQYSSSYLYEIRSHVSELHSIKYPEYDIHFRDEYITRWCLDGDPKELQEDEVFSRIYQSLDQIIDKDVHGCVEEIKLEPICIIKEEPEDPEEEEDSAPV